MLYLQQLKLKRLETSTTGNSYFHVTSLNQIGTQATSNTPHNGKLYDRRICKLGDETKKFKNMGYEMALVERKYVLYQLRVYWDKVRNNDADYFTKHHPPI